MTSPVSHRRRPPPTVPGAVPGGPSRARCWGSPSRARGSAHGPSIASGSALPAVDHLATYRPAMPLRIYSRDGVLLAEYGIERREFTPLAQIPLRVRHALLAAEDAPFLRTRAGGLQRPAARDVDQPRRRSFGAGRQHDLDAGRAQLLPDARQADQPQARGDPDGLQARTGLRQGQAARAVHEPDLPR